MRHIALKTLGSVVDPPLVDYAQVLRDVIRRPLNGEQGATIGEMRQSLRVLDALDAADGTLDLEDADYEHLKQKLAAMPWNVIDKRVVQLFDDVTNAQ